MDPLELYAKMPDGGPWFQLAAGTWELIAIVVAIFATILLVIFLSAREKSLLGRVMRLLRAPHADHLFMRVTMRHSGTGDDQPPSQAYLSSLAPHEMRLYSKYALRPGDILAIDPPGVHVVVQHARLISEDPPWFAIEAEPVFRDDVTRRNYRKFLGELAEGELSRVA